MRRGTPAGRPRQDLALKLVRGVERGSIARVREVLTEGASVDGTMEFRPIVVAATRMNLMMVEFLVEHGADVNAPSHIVTDDLQYRYMPIAGTRALHLAACCGRVNIVRVLLQAGANPNVVDTNGCTPLMSGCSSTVEVRAAQMTALRASNSSNGAGLDTALDIHNPHMETVRELLETGADPLMTDDEGRLALHFAAITGDDDLISMLLSVAPHTANQPTARRHTAMFLAAKEGHATAVDLLLSAGATPTVDPIFGPCPIMEAVFQCREEVLRVFIEQGSDNYGELLRQHPIVVVAAVAQGNARILKQVITAVRGEDQQLQLHCYSDVAGPVLHYAAGHGLPSSVRLLLAEGADESALDYLGQQACDVVGTMDEAHPPQDCRIDPTLPKSRKRDPVKEALILRLLEQGPAFRARSWAWPAGPSSSSAAAAAADTVPKRAPYCGMLSARLLVVRPINNKKMAFFVKRICRHARKK